MPQCCIHGHKIASAKSFYLQLLDHSNKATLMYYFTFSLGVRVCTCMAVYSSDVFSFQALVTRLQCEHTLISCRCFVFHSLLWTLSNALSCFRLALNQCKPRRGLILSDSHVRAAVSCTRRNW